MVLRVFGRVCGYKAGLYRWSCVHSGTMWRHHLMKGGAQHMQGAVGSGFRQHYHILHMLPHGNVPRSVESRLDVVVKGVIASCALQYEIAHLRAVIVCFV